MTRGRIAAVLPALYVASLLGFADRIIFSLALQPIKLQFGFSDSQLGLLAGLAFGISYAAFSPVAGYLGDRRSRKAVLLIAVLGWSAATFATAFATSFATMFTARALVGMGEAAVMPLAASMLSDTREPAARGKAFGLFMSASALGTALGMIFGGAVIAAITKLGGLTLPIVGRLHPWQVLFVAAALLGVIFVVVVFFVLREPPRAERQAASRPEDAGVRRFIAANPMVVFTLYVGTSFVQMSTVTNLIWLVPAFTRSHGLAPGTAALTIGLTAGLAMLAGCLVAGSAIARIKARGETGASLVACLVSGAMFAIFTSLGLLTDNLPLALTLVTIGTFFSYTPTISALSVIGEALPSSIRASLAGFNTMANALICNTLGSLIVGLLGDRLFTGAGSVADALACVILVGFAIGGGLIVMGLPAYRRRMSLVATEGGA